MKYNVDIKIALREGILDPEARAIRHALKSLGFDTESLNTARLFCITLVAADEREARAEAARMCERLLANPVIHRYEIEVRE